MVQDVTKPIYVFWTFFDFPYFQNSSFFVNAFLKLFDLLWMMCTNNILPGPDCIDTNLCVSAQHICNS